MDVNDIRGITTLLLMFTFIGIWIWAWSKKRTDSFTESANQIFDKDEEQIHQRSIEEANKK